MKNPKIAKNLTTTMMTLVKAKAKTNKTFIVQASLMIDKKILR
jgi:hypothetical protein